MKWLWLASSIAAEILGTSMLKLWTTGPKYAYAYLAGVVLCYAACFLCLAVTMKHFDLGALYATWSAVGIAMLALIGIIFFGDQLNLIKIISFALVILGVVGLNLSGVTR